MENSVAALEAALYRHHNNGDFAKDGAVVLPETFKDWTLSVDGVVVAPPFNIDDGQWHRIDLLSSAGYWAYMHTKSGS